MEIQFPVELQRHVEQAIVTGEFGLGQIVSAAGLAERFGASRDAMRQVLESEHRKGLLACQADGFRVLGLVPPKVESVFQHTSKAGFKPSSLARAVTVEPATAEVGSRLAVPVGAAVYRLVRTRLVNDEVLANQTNVIPYEVCAGLENDDLTHASFQQLIDVKYRAVTLRIDETFAMVPATDQDLQILGLEQGAQIVRIERLAYGATNCPLIWTDIHARPDRFHYVAALWPSAKPLLEEFRSKNH